MSFQRIRDMYGRGIVSQWRDIKVRWEDGVRCGEELRKSLYARAHMHEHNDGTHSRNTHTDVEREPLLVIICPVGCLGAFLQ